MEEKIKSVSVLTAEDVYANIRQNPTQYVGQSEDIFMTILTGIICDFSSLSIYDFIFECDEEKAIIYCNEDWLSSRKLVQNVFTAFLPLKKTLDRLDRVHSEMLLNAFEISFFTIGKNGSYGNEDLRDKLQKLS